MPIRKTRPAGWKHGRWVDVVVMQRRLGEGDGSPPEGLGWMASKRAQP